MPPRALLFAIDDCLVDWSDAIQAAVANALAVLNLSSEPLAARSLGEEITSYTWHMREGRVVERAHWRLFFEPGEPIDRAFPGYPPSMRREAARMFHAALKPALFADVLPSLSALSSRPLGVLSNSSLARVTLRRLGVLDRFAVVAIAEDPHRKPHKDAFARACGVLGLPPGDVAFVGSSLANDVESAVNAGHAPVFWIDRFSERRPVPRGATRIRSLSDLPALL